MIAQHLELSTHASSGKIHSLYFQSTPAHRMGGRMHQHMIDSSYIIAFASPFVHAFTFQEPDFADNAWLRRPEQFFANPPEDTVTFQKAVGTCRT
jgi:hypothetical protein